MGSPLSSQLAARNAPAMMPTTKKRFQASFFQSYLKYEILEGKQAAQIWRNEEETPNDLLPASNKTGTINPISGPEIYQGQGWLSQSPMFISRIYLRAYGKLLQYLLQLFCLHHARLPPFYLAFLKDNQCWNALHAICICCVWIFINIQLYDGHFIAHGIF